MGKATGLEPAVPDNLLAFNAAYRAAERELARPGNTEPWRFVWPPERVTESAGGARD